MTRSKAIRWMVIIVSLYLIASTTKRIFDLWGAGGKLTRREQNLAALQKERANLLRRQAKVNSSNYLERVARDQLGLARPGEQLIIISRDLLVDHVPVATPDATPNWQKWARLIF